MFVKISICIHLTKNKLIYMLILIISSRKHTLEWKAHVPQSFLCFMNSIFLRTKNWKLNTVWIITIVKKEQECVTDRTKARSPATVPDTPIHPS